MEDDPQITKLLDLHFNAPEYTLTSCTTGEMAISRLTTMTADLVILDMMLPGMNGMEVCRQIRRSLSDVPILMLTSKAEESDKVLALELGADDYVTKPFGVLELMARTKALLRRSAHAVVEVKEAPAIHRRDICIDEIARKVTLNNKRIELTPKEFDLLLLLAKHPGKAFTRKQLLQKVWDITFDGYEHTVTAHINRLRIKIEPDINNPDYILTAWGVGYRFVE